MSSTINVDQHKEKFWQVRVYCTLGHERLVEAWWDHAHSLWLTWDRDGRKTKRPQDLFGLNIENPEPPPSFRAMCLLRDAQHYRRVYQDMVAIRPDESDRICAYADYPELLHPTLGDAIAAVDQRARQHDAWVDHITKRYLVDDVSGLHRFLHDVYEPRHAP